MWDRQQSSPRSATNAASSGSWRNALTSLTYVAPAATAACATSSRVVSTESCARAPRPTSPSIAGTTRRICSSAGTGAAPGRVDSPPSRISAPSASSRRPCATAASASRKRPPSENESGVTFSTPMIRYGRSTAASSHARPRAAAWRRAASGSATGERVVHLEELDCRRPRHPGLLRVRADLLLGEAVELGSVFPHVGHADAVVRRGDPVEQQTLGRRVAVCQLHQLHHAVVLLERPAGKLQRHGYRHRSFSLVRESEATVPRRASARVTRRLRELGLLWEFQRARLGRATGQAGTRERARGVAAGALRAAGRQRDLGRRRRLGAEDLFLALPFEQRLEL